MGISNPMRYQLQGWFSWLYIHGRVIHVKYLEKHLYMLSGGDADKRSKKGCEHEFYNNASFQSFIISGDVSQNSLSILQSIGKVQIPKF